MVLHIPANRAVRLERFEASTIRQRRAPAGCFRRFMSAIIFHKNDDASNGMNNWQAVA
jgi:hypothetical protein